VRTGGAPRVVLSYRLLCNGRSVTTNWIGDGLLVLNPAAVFMTVVGETRRPHSVRLELPDGWHQAMSGLDQASDRLPNHFVAPDYDTLVDRPIVAGDLSVHEFVVDGSV